MTRPRYISVTPPMPPSPLNFTCVKSGIFMSASLPKAVPEQAPIPAINATHSQFLAFLIVFSGADYCRIIPEEANTFFGENAPPLVRIAPGRTLRKHRGRGRRPEKVLGLIHLD